jgi:hypothetical protein
MNTTDKKIAEVLAKFGEPMAGNVWRVQGTAVIYHKTLERIAAMAKIHFDEPKIIRAERDEAVRQVTGHIGAKIDGATGAITGFARSEWSIGEAVIGVNYRVSGKQAAYVYAIAEKRAKDRVILKLIELHGYVYSEEEADEFKQQRVDARTPEVREESRQRVQSGGGKGAREYLDDDRQDDRQAELVRADQNRIEDDLKAKIRKAKTINAVTDLMLHDDTQKALADLPEGIRDEIRDFAKARLVELGWPVNREDREPPKQDNKPEPEIRQNPEDRQPPEEQPGNGGLETHPPKPYTPEESKRHLDEALASLKRVKSWDDLKAWAAGLTQIRPRLQSEDNAKLETEFEKAKAKHKPKR